MDNLELNRLNFANIVDKQLRNLPETKYFNPTQVNSKFNKLSKNAKSEKQMINENFNIQRKIDSIVAYVHTQLKNANPAPKSKPISVTSAKEALMKKIERAKSNNKHIVIDNPAYKKINIPRIKVLCDQKKEKRLHHTIPPPNNKDSHYINHQRLQEAKRQQKIYENLLQDQKHLQNDRQSIAQEIFTMRSYLDAIRERLDVSLRKLDDNKTYTECHSEREQKEEKSQTLKDKRRNNLNSSKK